jgi:hypothetical protein
VTRNLDALLAENQALRQEVMFLRQQLAGLQARGTGEGRREGGAGITAGSAPGITAAQVRQWGDALARHPRWREVRIGASPRAGGHGTGRGLKALIEDLRQRDWGSNGRGELEDDLDRRWPGLGTDLRWALQGPQSKARMAVRAAFALYGAEAPERLTSAPLRVVDDLLAGLDRLEAAAWQASQQQARQQQARTQQAPAEGRQQREVLEALEALGLPWGATSDAVKAAHRRLVKQHHPDMGGDAEAFRRINAAYQWLTA